jgi:hypothetical protein
MADDPTGTDTNGNPPAGTADQPPTPSGLTADAVKQMIAEAVSASEKKAYDRGAAETRRALERKQQPNTAKPDQPNEPNTPTSQPAANVDGFALSEAMAEFPTLSKDQRKKIRDLASKETPPDLDGFVEQWAGLFGVKKADSSASTNTNNSPAPTENKQSPPQPGPPLPAPGPTPDRELTTIFKAMGDEAARDTWQAYVRQRGANPANPYDPRNREVWREMRRKFEAGLATATLHLGARRGS